MEARSSLQELSTDIRFPDLGTEEKNAEKLGFPVVGSSGTW